MAGYDIELVLHSVNFKASHQLYTKAVLTVQTAEGEKYSYSHLVRHANVPFYQQVVRMKNADSFQIELVLTEGTRGSYHQTHSFTVNLLQMMNDKELRRKYHEEIKRLKCEVVYEVFLKEPNLLEDSSSIDTSKFMSKLKEKEDREDRERMSPEFVRGDMPSKFSPANKSLAKGHHGQKELEDFPVAKETAATKPTFRRSNTSISVQPTEAEVKTQFVELQKLKREHIRKPPSGKVLNVSEIEEQLERILFLRYLSENNNIVTTRLSTRNIKLKEELKAIHEKKQQFEQRQKQWATAPSPFATRLAFITALLLGIVVSILYHL